MENAVFERIVKRKMKKQGMEKQRRDKIKKSLDELTMLIPEARKRISQGQRLKQTQILQLTVDYIRSGYLRGNEEKESFRPWNPRIRYDNASCHQRFQCSSHTNPFQQRIGKTKPNQRLSHGSQNEHFCRSLEDPHYLPSVQNQSDTILSPLESEFLISSNLGHSAMEVALKAATASTPPLQALQSLCSSITSDDFTAQATEDVLCTGNHLKCATTSQFELASISQRKESQVIIPEMLQPIAALPRSLVQAETRDLWRPWDYERAKDKLTIA